MNHKDLTPNENERCAGYEKIIAALCILMAFDATEHFWDDLWIRVAYFAYLLAAATIFYSVSVMRRFVAKWDRNKETK